MTKSQGRSDGQRAHVGLYTHVYTMTQRERYVGTCNKHRAEVMCSLAGQLRPYSKFTVRSAAKVSDFTVKSEEAKLTAQISAVNFRT